MFGHAGVVHAQGAALFVVGHRLNHRPEDVGIDVLPIQASGLQQVAARYARETRHLRTAREKSAVHVFEFFSGG